MIQFRDDLLGREVGAEPFEIAPDQLVDGGTLPARELTRTGQDLIIDRESYIHGTECRQERSRCQATERGRTTGRRGRGQRRKRTTVHPSATHATSNPFPP